MDVADQGRGRSKGSLSGTLNTPWQIPKAAEVLSKHMGPISSKRGGREGKGPLEVMRARKLARAHVLRAQENLDGLPALLKKKGEGRSQMP